MPQAQQTDKPIIDMAELLGPASSKPMAGDTQAFDPRTGAGAEAYARRGARQSLASKVKTTGQQSAEDINEFGKEMYGSLYDPYDPATGKGGHTIERNVGMWSLPYQAAGYAGMPLKTAVKTAAGGIAGSMAGAYGGGHAGHYLGGIPGRLARNPKLEQQGAGVGEAIGAFGGGVVGGYGGGAAAMGGGRIPLKLRIGGVPVEGELPMGGVGRAGSAGDLASWGESDLWEGYMRNRGTPQGEALAREIQRRGLATSPSGTYRPPQPSSPSPSPAAPPPPTQPSAAPAASAGPRKAGGTLLQKMAERGSQGASKDWMDEMFGPLPKKWL